MKTDFVIDPVSRSYQILGLASAGVLLLTLVERQAGFWAIVPAVVAASAIGFRWSSGPVFVVLATAIALLITYRQSGFQTPAAEAVLSGSLLAYCLSQYRITSFASTILPPDHRPELSRNKPTRRGLPGWIHLVMRLLVVPHLLYRMFAAKPSPPRLMPRDGNSAGHDELARALFSIVLVTILTLTAWWGVLAVPVPFRIPDLQWRLGLCIWVLLTTLVLCLIVINVRSYRQLPAEQARMILQETIWKETRGEQTQIARFTAIARTRLEQRAARRRS